MNDSPANPKKFHLQPGDAVGFSDGGDRVGIAWDHCTEQPEIELLGRLKEVGAVFPDESAAMEIIRSAGLTNQEMSDGNRKDIVKLIARLAKAPTAEKCGQEVFILAFLLKLPIARTQSELAAKLRMTQGRVSQLINKISESFDEH